MDKHYYDDGGDKDLPRVVDGAAPCDFTRSRILFERETTLANCIISVTMIERCGVMTSSCVRIIRCSSSRQDDDITLIRIKLAATQPSCVAREPARLRESSLGSGNYHVRNLGKAPTGKT